jgi:hypothetical protein
MRFAVKASLDAQSASSYYPKDLADGRQSSALRRVAYRASLLCFLFWPATFKPLSPERLFLWAVQ